MTLTPTAARRLYIWALCVGVVAALLMTFFPPSITRHSGEGGRVLLGVLLLLQLLAILAQPTKQ